MMHSVDQITHEDTFEASEKEVAKVVAGTEALQRLVRQHGHQLSALGELVSAGDKDRTKAERAFGRVLSYLRREFEASVANMTTTEGKLKEGARPQYAATVEEFERLSGRASNSILTALRAEVL